MLADLPYIHLSDPMAHAVTAHADFFLALLPSERERVTEYEREPEVCVDSEGPVSPNRT
jgi:hypothetical protein